MSYGDGNFVSYTQKDISFGIQHDWVKEVSCGISSSKSGIGGQNVLSNSYVFHQL